MFIIMSLGVLTNRLTHSYDMGLNLTSLALRGLDKTLCAFQVFLDIRESGKLSIQRNESGLHPLDLNVSFTDRKLQMLDLAL